MGVPAFKFKLGAFAIGAAVGGLSGSCSPARQGFINSDSFIAAERRSCSWPWSSWAGREHGRRRSCGAILVAYLPERLRFVAEWRDRWCSGRAGRSGHDLPAAGHLPTRGGGGVRRRAARTAEEEVTRRWLSNLATEHGPPSSTDVAGPPLLRVDNVDAAVRRCGRARRGQLQHPQGRDPRPDRTQRRRQDHLLQRDDRRVQADRGRRAVRRQRISGRKPHKITEMGIARTFQNIRFFPEMTAMENVHGGHRLTQQHVLGAVPLYRVRAPSCRVTDGCAVRSGVAKIRAPALR